MDRSELETRLGDMLARAASVRDLASTLEKELEVQTSRLKSLENKTRDLENYLHPHIGISEVVNRGIKVYRGVVKFTFSDGTKVHKVVQVGPVSRFEGSPRSTVTQVASEKVQDWMETHFKKKITLLLGN